MISDKEARQYILQQLYDEGYWYLARDESAFLYAHKDRPRKKQNIWDGWGCVNSCTHIYSFSCFKDIKWADEEPLDIAKELGIIDWTKVPKDTKVLVWKDDEKKKVKRYFSHYDKQVSEAPFCVFCDGGTSWSVPGLCVRYAHCSLFEGEEAGDD